MFEKRTIPDQALEFKLVLESYGVRVKIQASSQRLLDDTENVARKALLGRLRILDNIDADHLFVVSEDSDGTLHLTRNDDHVSYDASRPRFFKFFDSLLRITIAEHANGWVFIHAGVVGWRGKAIVLPAASFRGKSTLVKELIRNGAEYYSDEYAVLDERGLVHSFPRDLALRFYDSGFKEKHESPQEIGAKVGEIPIPIGLVVLTEYSENGSWKPDRLSIGRGLMEVIPHTIPRLFNPEFTLKVLNTAVSDAIILKSVRGEASKFAAELLLFFDEILN